MQELDMDTLLFFDAHRAALPLFARKVNVFRKPRFVIYSLSITRDSWRSVK